MAIRQDTGAKGIQTQGQRLAASQMQGLIAAQGQELEAQVVQALLINPSLALDGDALEIDDDYRDETDSELTDDGWNEDFDRDIDEYETGTLDAGTDLEDWQNADFMTALQREALEKWGDDPDEFEKIWEQIEHYWQNGALPDDADDVLKAILERLEKDAVGADRMSHRPTFEVRVRGNQVQAVLIPTLADRLRINKTLKHSSKQKKAAEGFINQVQLRRKNLESLAEVLLEGIQADFFRQPDLKSALQHLVPVKDINGLGIFAPIKMDKSYRSYTGSLLVACDLGAFPLHIFWPSVAELVRMWVRFAFDEGIDGVKDQIEWINVQLSNIMNKFSNDDPRADMMNKLLACKETDIKNARKAIKASQ